MKLPFSLFDFKNHVNKFEPVAELVHAAAAAAIPETAIYTVPAHKIALLMAVTVKSTKTTSTAFECYIKRALYKSERKGAVTVTTYPLDRLIAETLGTTEVYASWPPAKTAANWSVGWHICFLHEGDSVCITHGLTAAETIDDLVIVHRIEYKDPRYPNG